tara:strand:+ start:36 stop:782 length:747 start_codon:yes stop_codon:yes gene_type:complete
MFFNIGIFLRSLILKSIKKLLYPFIYLKNVLQTKNISDIGIELQKSATRETSLYVKENMQFAHVVRSRKEVLDFAFDNTNIDGLKLEFGVFQGESLNYIASSNPEWFVYGFDSFDGLPESWGFGGHKGLFKVKSIPKVRKNVKLYKGLFKDSIITFLNNLRYSNTLSKISFLHIDVDLYSSTKTIFDLIGDLICEGTIIVFDDYFNYVNWQNNEFLAFQEFILSKSLTYNYLSYNEIGCSVAVLIQKK